MEVNKSAEPEEKKMRLNDFAKDVHRVAVEHGWWEKEPSFPEIIALCHCELSEALQEYRKGKEATEVYVEPAISPMRGMHNAPHGIPIELADVILWILDYCAHVGIDIETFLEKKHEFNKTRPYKHGGKVI